MLLSLNTHYVVVVALSAGQAQEKHRNNCMFVIFIDVGQLCLIRSSDSTSRLIPEGQIAFSELVL